MSAGLTGMAAGAGCGGGAENLSSGLDLRLVELGRVKEMNGIWHFRTDPDGLGEREGWFRPETATGPWSEITVPHTWQVSPELSDYMGAAWYRKEFRVPESWASGVVRLEFEAVYHSATVWVNGKPVGEHLRKGYTAFCLEITRELLSDGGRNVLAVKVNNSFDKKMLPRGDSYDWAEDGGIIRPVNLLLTPKTFIERVAVDAVPDLQNNRAELAIRLALRNCSERSVPLAISYRVEEEDTGRTVLAKESAATLELAPGSAGEVTLAGATLDEPRLWHFDHPHLYRLVAAIEYQGKALHQYCTTFGVRRFEVSGEKFLLNGEHVRLMGVERMGGSHPDHGMAEPEFLIKVDHDGMKETNCVFTRVHWPQDKRVLDYCDRHGILIQVEVPAWGGGTFRDMEGDPDPDIVQNGLEQLTEMIRRDYNHPSIFAWGLANEIKGQHPPAYKFVKRMYEEAALLDPHRLRSYAADSLYETPEKDVSALMDFVEWNEYWESWYPGSLDDLRGTLEQIHRAFPGKPLVISEYGYLYSYPGFSGGEVRMIELLCQQTELFREFDFIGGTIYFCYNDYRTQKHDIGRGPLRQRACGVVNVLGERKKSFETLRRQCSPVKALRLKRQRGMLSATVTARDTLPSHRLHGYRLRWTVYGPEEAPAERYTASLPDLDPGGEATVQLPFEEKAPSGVRVEVLRPTGFSVSTGWWH
ncbi:glycoside hydrolase family 2 protein [Gemmatimonadota bacterium]